MLLFQNTLDSAETRVLTFDMSGDLAAGETLTGLPVITAMTIDGVDPAPQAIMTGRTTFDSTNTQVLVQVGPRVPNVTYAIKAVSPTTNPAKTLAIKAALVVT